MIIDLHSHFFPLESARSSAAPVGAAPEQVEDGSVLEVAGHRLHLSQDLIDVDAQLTALERQGLDRRALMPPPYTILYELSGEDGLAWSVALNDGISDGRESRVGPLRRVRHGAAAVADGSRDGAAAGNAVARTARGRDPQQRGRNGTGRPIT